MVHTSSQNYTLVNAVMEGTNRFVFIFIFTLTFHEVVTLEQNQGECPSWPDKHGDFLKLKLHL